MTADTQAQPSPEKEKEMQTNLSRMRKLLEQAERSAVSEKERADGLQRQHEEFVASQSQQAPDDDDDASDPYVDRKTLNKKMSQWEKNLEAKFEKKAEEKAMSLIERERQTQYVQQNADFNTIMTPEIMEKFQEEHPSIVKSLLNMPDNFHRQKVIYETVKALGVHKKKEPAIQQTIDRNQRHPGMYQTAQVGAAPYATSANFSPQGQKEAYDQMKGLQKRMRIG